MMKKWYGAKFCACTVTNLRHQLC